MTEDVDSAIPVEARTQTLGPLTLVRQAATSPRSRCQCGAPLAKPGVYGDQCEDCWAAGQKEAGPGRLVERPAVPGGSLTR